jgi:hypothetical protein
VIEQFNKGVHVKMVIERAKHLPEAKFVIEQGRSAPDNDGMTTCRPVHCIVPQLYL